MVHPQALMEAVSANLNWFLQPIGENLTKPQKKFLRDGLVGLLRAGNHLLIYGDTENVGACKAALKRWLGRKTHEHLVPWLKRLAAEGGFFLGHVVVKSQKTRWASCSRRKTVSLNLKLLFIPSELIRYVFTHELCHTHRLDHSSGFWALLRQHVLDYKAQDGKLRAAWRFVPAWIDRHKMSSQDVPGTRGPGEGE